MDRGLFCLAVIFLLALHSFVSSLPILLEQGRKLHNILSVLRNLVLVSVSVSITDLHQFLNIKILTNTVRLCIPDAVDGRSN